MAVTQNNVTHKVVLEILNLLQALFFMKNIFMCKWLSECQWETFEVMSSKERGTGFNEVGNCTLCLLFIHRHGCALSFETVHFWDGVII
jgi:hypothetical protein